MFAPIDFETFSECDLKKAGAWKYAQDPSTEVLMMAWAIGFEAPQLWLPGMSFPERLRQHIARGGLLDAHGSTFEEAIWTEVCSPRMGWPEVEPHQWDCTMARCASRAIPLGLDQATMALGTQEKKDPEGKRLIKLFCVPQKITKKQTQARIFPADRPEEFAKFGSYCLDDVRSEQAMRRELKDLPAPERRVFIYNQAMNRRGITIDLESVHNARFIASKVEARLTEKLREVTCDEIQTHNQVARITEWLGARGVHLDDLQAGTVAEALPDVQRSHGRGSPEHTVLSIRADLAKASTKKLDGLIACTGRDGRVRGLSQYHGAFTGRNAGRLVQPLNLPRPRLDAEPEALIDAIAFRDDEWLEALYGCSALQVIADALRPMFMAGDGRVLVACDLSAIEAVGTAALAGEETKLDVFRRGEDPYCHFASFALKRPITKKENPKERQAVGKPGELAFGYGGGVNAWRNFDDSDTFTDEEVDEFKKAWRLQHPMISTPPWSKDHAVGFWYGLQAAAISAMQGKPTSFRDIHYERNGRWLVCTLPSSRRICYFDPKLISKPHRFREGEYELVLSYMSVKNGRWKRVETWGGKLCLSGYSEVLTPHGWKRMLDASNDFLWDGEEWVRHDGLIEKGVQETRPLDGVWMTAGHEVLTARGWRHASICEGLHRAPVRLPDSGAGHRHHREAAPVGGAVRLRSRDRAGGQGVRPWPPEVMWLQALRTDRRRAEDTRYGGAPGLRSLEVHARSLSTAHPPSMEELRGSRDYGMRGVGELRELLVRHGANLSVGPHAGAQEQHGGVLSGQLPVGRSSNAGEQQEDEPPYFHPLGSDDDRAGGAPFRSWGYDPSLPDRARLGGGRVVPSARRYEETYDILNCGPRNRFVVRGTDGPFIVHNCENVVQASCRDVLECGRDPMERRGIPVLMSIYDELVAEVDEDFGGKALEAMLECMTSLPSWCATWPVKAEGWVGKRYRK
ncbi:MAG: hypothetical protein AB7U76_24300 [Pirellulales bacterium]